MKSIPQIEKEINRQLDKFFKYFAKGGIENIRNAYATLSFINGMGYVLGQKERMQISEKTRERLLKATKEYRNENH